MHPLVKWMVQIKMVNGVGRYPQNGNIRACSLLLQFKVNYTFDRSKNVERCILLLFDVNASEILLLEVHSAAFKSLIDYCKIRGIIILNTVKPNIP